MNDNIIYNILLAAIGVLLFVAGVEDFRKKQISRGLLMALIFVCFAAIPFKEDFRILDALGGLLIGVCGIGISMMSREQIGRGDGFVIAAVGIVLGIRKCLAAVCASSLMMCMAAIIILIVRKGNRYTRLPFLPAVFVGYVLCIGKVLI